MSSDRIALVLGATGGIGGETASAFARRGWKIRAFARSGKQEDRERAWEWVQGDALNESSVVQAAQGASAIVHAVNPPGSRNWAKVVIPMIENTITAAKSSGARILLPGTIYNYAPDAYPVLREDSPQNATSHKGVIRVELEALLRSAERDGVRSLIVRFGDFFGPKPGNSWFSQGMIKPHQAVKSIVYPGKKGVGHAWTYLPDAAETFAMLMDRETELESFARYHFSGFWDADGTMMISAIRAALRNQAIPVQGIPWWFFTLASPFNETLRELAATRPLWETPIQLDNTRLVQFLGSEPRTPLADAMRATLQGLGVTD